VTYHGALTFRPTPEQLAQGAVAACLLCGATFKDVAEVDRSECRPKTERVA
jgi:hypothetical protein